MTLKPDAIAYPPRGMSREESARYIGVGTDLFDQMVADRRMPKGKRINRRVVWDRVSLDMAFTALPGDDERNFFDQPNAIDAILASRKT
jgi:predicted DNA-binding transcriptional regulator AlpA